MIKNIVVILVTLLLFPQLTRADIYTIDPEHTHIGFSVKHLVISNVKGKFNVFSGTVETDEKDNIKAATIEIAAASIDTAHEKRDKHLRSPDFLDVDQYPVLTFKYKSTQSRSGNRYKVLGDLSLHGVTQEVILDMELLGKVTDPWGNFRAGVSGTTTLNRQDFGVVWNKVLETGGLVVGDIIQVSLEVEGIRKK